MRLARPFVVGLLLFGAQYALAEPTKWIFTFGGKPVGSGTHEDMADGSFKDESSAQIATQKLFSNVSGKFEKGKLLWLDLDAGNGANHAVVKYKNGKITASNNGKEAAKDVAFDVKGDVFLATLNPALTGVTLAKLVASKPSVEMDVFLIDNFVSLKSKFTRKSVTAELKSGPRPAEIYTFNINGLDVQYAFVESDCVGMNVPAQMFGGYREGFEGVFADPVLKYKELSQPTFKVKNEVKVISPMPDGAQLVCDIARPDDDLKHPVVLIRTPYGRGLNMAQGDFWASRGYVLVAQDVRGRGASNGEWDPFNREVADGKDTLDWLVKQPWCDGNVGMIGGSYLGMVQWSAAVTHHPALKAIIPQVSPPDPTRNIPWDHGAFMLAPGLWWSRVVKEKDADLANMMKAIDNPKSFFSLPLTTVDNKMFKQNIDFFDLWLKRPTLAEWKGAFRNDQIGSVTIPTLHISGIWDGDGIGTKLHWADGKSAGRKNQWMIFGPWEHGFNAKTKFADQDYGSQSILELDSIYLRFFDTFLKGKSVKWEAEPRAKVFVTGANQWFFGDEYPFPYAKLQKLYLAGASALGAKSKGILALAQSGLTQDTFVYDPNKPKYKGTDITPGGSTSTMIKPQDASPNDLTYSTTPFSDDTIVTGPIKADLYVSTTAKDATFHIMIFDQYPDGRIQTLGLPGTKRIWFDALGKPGPIEPNKVYRISLEPWEFAHQFKKGHRLALYIASDLFPQFARNPGTGEPDWKATKLFKAKHTIYRSPKYPSTLTYYSFVP